MIARHDEQEFVRVTFEGGSGDRRRRSARAGLEDQACIHDAGLVELGRDQPGKFLGDHDQGRREKRRIASPRERLLEQGGATVERDERLGPILSRQGPQPRPRAAAQDHRLDAQVGRIHRLS
jgi:hypothetical protein